MSSNANLTPLGGGDDDDQSAGNSQAFTARGGGSSRGGRGGRGGNRGNRRRREPAAFAASAHTTADADRIIREQFNLDNLGASSSQPMTARGGGGRGGFGSKRKHSAGTSPHAKRVQWSNPFDRAGESNYAQMMQKRRWFGVHANNNYQSAASVSAGDGSQRGAKRPGRGRGGVTGSVPLDLMRPYGISRGAFMRAEDEAGKRTAAMADKRRALLSAEVPKKFYQELKTAADKDGLVHTGRAVAELANAMTASTSRGLRALDRRMDEFERKVAARFNQAERQTKKQCTVFKSTRFVPPQDRFYTDIDLLNLARVLTLAKYGVKFEFEDIRQIHPIGKPSEGMIIVAWKSMAPGTPFAMLTDRRNLPPEFKGKKVGFDLTVSVASTNYDRTIQGALEWTRANNGFMLEKARFKNVTEERAVPHRRRIVDSGICPASNIPWVQTMDKKGVLHRKSIGSFDELRAFMGGRHLDAYLLGSPSNRWVLEPEASAAAGSASTTEEQDADALVESALAASSGMNFETEEVYVPPEVIEDNMEEQ